MNKEKLDELALEAVKNYFLNADASLSYENFEIQHAELIRPFLIKACDFDKDGEKAVNYFIKKYNEIFDSYTKILEEIYKKKGE